MAGDAGRTAADRGPTAARAAQAVTARPAGPAAATATAPAPAQPAHLSATARRVAAVAAGAQAVAAMPAAPAPAARGSRAADGAAQPPAVRVHIGRLEVRANLQAPPPAPTIAPRASRSEGQGLSAYLRGERAT